MFFDLFNIYNRQGEAGVDDNYAPQFKLSAPNSTSGTEQNANPVSGGTYEDLIWVKTIDSNGNETAVADRHATRTSATRRVATRPANGRLGLRLTF